jgi:hypothetical protein
LPYDRLVLATGGRARLLADLPDGIANVVTLRSAADAQALRTHLNDFRSMTVIGGGFIGLEFAATGCSLGKAVTVVESAPRLLARAVSPEVSTYVLQVHREAGIDIHLDARISGFEIEQPRAAPHGGRPRLAAIASTPSAILSTCFCWASARCRKPLWRSPRDSRARTASSWTSTWSRAIQRSWRSGIAPVFRYRQRTTE